VYELIHKIKGYSKNLQPYILEASKCKSMIFFKHDENNKTFISTYTSCSGMYSIHPVKKPGFFVSHVIANTMNEIITIHSAKLNTLCMCAVGWDVKPHSLTSKSNSPTQPVADLRLSLHNLNVLSVTSGQLRTVVSQFLQF